MDPKERAKLLRSYLDIVKEKKLLEEKLTVIARQLFPVGAEASYKRGRGMTTIITDGVIKLNPNGVSPIVSGRTKGKDKEARSQMHKLIPALDSAVSKLYEES